MLARLRRPDRFEDVKGNDNAIRILETKLDEPVDKRPRAFLLHGPTGCGKTTLAYILAREIGAYASCIFERDMVALSGKDDVDALVAEASTRPLQGKFKVYILDEAHEVSEKAKSALLKPMEQAPAHVVYILCTNKLKKLPKELRDRCCCIEVQPLTFKQTIELLDEAIAVENVQVPDEVTKAIADDCDGCPRQALSMLENIMHLDPKEMLDALQTHHVTESVSIDLCRALMAPKGPDGKKIAEILETIEGDSEGIRLAVLGYARSVLIKNHMSYPQALLVMEAFKEPFFHDGKFRLALACGQACM